MKNRNITASLVMLCALLFCATGAMAAQATMNAGLTKSVLESDKKQTAYLKVGLTGFEMAREHKRAPVNIALVIDRSGSMQGEKIRRAQDAAIAAISRLNSEDIVSVVAFDSGVDVLLPATKLTDMNAVTAAIRGIRANGSTALFAGVSKGAEEVRKFKGLERFNRVILLTDGQANIGPSSPSELGVLGDSFRKEGLSVTTLGLGADYNEDLLYNLAGKSGGNHGYIAKVEDLASFFQAEFDDALSVCAQEVTVSIDCAAGVRPVRVLNREAEITGQNVRLSLNQLFSKQEKYAVLEVEISAGKDGESKLVANVTGTYANMSTKSTDKIVSTVSVAFSTNRERVEKSENRDAMIAAVDQIALEKNKLATQLRDEGKIVEATRIFGENEKTLRSYGEKYQSKELIDNSTWNGNASKDAQNPAEWIESRKGTRSRQQALEAQGNAVYTPSVKPKE